MSQEDFISKLFEGKQDPEVLSRNSIDILEAHQHGLEPLTTGFNVTMSIELTSVVNRPAYLTGWKVTDSVLRLKLVYRHPREFRRPERAAVTIDLRSMPRGNHPGPQGLIEADLHLSGKTEYDADYMLVDIVLAPEDVEQARSYFHEYTPSMEDSRHYKRHRNGYRFLRNFPIMTALPSLMRTTIYGILGAGVLVTMVQESRREENNRVMCQQFAAGEDLRDAEYSWPGISINTVDEPLGVLDQVLGGANGLTIEERRSLCREKLGMHIPISVAEESVRKTSEPIVTRSQK